MVMMQDIAAVQQYGIVRLAKTAGNQDYNKQKLTTVLNQPEFKPTPYCCTLTVILTLTCDLESQNHVTSKTSSISQGHSLYQV